MLVAREGSLSDEAGGAISGRGVICTRSSVCVKPICSGRFLRWCSPDWSLGCTMMWGESVGRGKLWSEVCVCVCVCVLKCVCLCTGAILLLCSIPDFVYKVDAWFYHIFLKHMPGFVCGMCMCEGFLWAWIFMCSWGDYSFLEVAIGIGDIEGCVSMHVYMYFIFIFLYTTFS